MSGKKAWSPTKLQIIGMMAVFLQSCGIKTATPASTSCQANTAQIAVYDSSMQRLCGCAEQSGLYYGVGQSLNCTVSVGTTVFFSYIGISNNHQLFIQSLITFPLRSGGSGVTQTDAFPLNSTGTFTFQDSYTTMGGTFIVQ